MTELVKKEIVIEENYLWLKVIIMSSFKIMIEINAHQTLQKSYAKLKIWNKESMTWNLLTDIHSLHMKTTFSKEHSVPLISLFKEDIKLLLQEYCILIVKEYEGYFDLGYAVDCYLNVILKN